MTLYRQILSDLTQAMKEKQAERLSVLRMLKTAIENERIARMQRDGEPDDAFVITILKRYKKQQEDALADFERGGPARNAAPHSAAGRRQDMIDSVKAEIAFVSAYLPAEMDDAAIDVIIKEVLAGVPEANRNFGAVMGAVMKKVAGQADGGRVKARVEATLQ